MAKDLVEHIRARTPKSFKPSTTYGANEDSLVFYFREDEAHEDRIDELLTLYRANDSEDVVGCQVKGIRHRLDGLGKFGVVIKGEAMKLDLLFHLLAYTVPDPPVQTWYYHLGRQAKNRELEFLVPA